MPGPAARIRARNGGRSPAGVTPRPFFETCRSCSGHDGTHLRPEPRGGFVSEFASADEGGVAERNSLSIPWVVAAALLCGIGLFLVLNAVILLAGGLMSWLWWIGILPAVVGFTMLLNPRAGSQGPH
jgi:predicted cobalt transporter CbtA